MGTTAQSEQYEFHYADAKSIPTLVPSHPGTYTVQLSADLAKPDPLFPSVLHAESTVDITVEGPVTAAAGCRVGGNAGGSSALLVLGALLAAAVRRRRAA